MSKGNLSQEQSEDLLQVFLGWKLEEYIQIP